MTPDRRKHLQEVIHHTTQARTLLDRILKEEVAYVKSKNGTETASEKTLVTDLQDCFADLSVVVGKLGPLSRD